MLWFIFAQQLKLTYKSGKDSESLAPMSPTSFPGGEYGTLFMADRVSSVKVKKSTFCFENNENNYKYALGKTRQLDDVIRVFSLQISVWLPYNWSKFLLFHRAVKELPWRPEVLSRHALVKSRGRIFSQQKYKT